MVLLILGLRGGVSNLGEPALGGVSILGEPAPGVENPVTGSFGEPGLGNEKTLSLLGELIGEAQVPIWFREFRLRAAPEKVLLRLTGIRRRDSAKLLFNWRRM